MNTAAAIDLAEQTTKTAAHRLSSGPAKAHLEYALAHIREAYIFELGDHGRTPSDLHKDVTRDLNFLQAVLPSVDVYRDDDTKEYSVLPGPGKHLLHPDDHIPCQTEIILFRSPTEALNGLDQIKADCEGKDITINVSEVEPLNERLFAAFVEYLELAHEGREIPASFYDPQKPRP